MTAMTSGAAQRLTRILLVSCVTAASALLVYVLYGWLVDALSDATVPITLIAVLLVTLASFMRPEAR
jgi:F0F1-type ATP synthase assembly protein I